MDLIYKGQASGSVASTLLANNFDVDALRPYIGDDGRTSFITRNSGGKEIAIPIQNNATLRKDEWINLDTAVIAAAKERLGFVADVRGRGLTYNLPNGMGTTVLQTQSMSDITEAKISMEPARAGESDRPEFDLTNLPLPIIHKDFSFHARQIATSRNGGTPIDLTTAALAGRRVAEEAEKLALGVRDTFRYGGGVVYGLKNFPSRITKSDLANPTDTGWAPADTLADLLAMRKLGVAAKHYGPWMVYNTPDWDEFLDADFSTQYPGVTLRERLLKVQGVQGIKTLDYLTGDFNLIMVQMTSDVVRMVVGMDITTVQWEENGGLTQNFKVMAILVPQFRADFNGNSGVIHGSVA